MYINILIILINDFVRIRIKFDILWWLFQVIMQLKCIYCSRKRCSLLFLLTLETGNVKIFCSKFIKCSVWWFHSNTFCIVFYPLKKGIDLFKNTYMRYYNEQYSCAIVATHDEVSEVNGLIMWNKVTIRPSPLSPSGAQWPSVRSVLLGKATFSKI